MDKLLAMRVFTRVVETGSFTRASESLDIPRATVTKLVQGLEAELRTSLLRRTTRRVAVTPDGAAYYERVLALMTELDEIEAGMTNARIVPRGRLRVEVGVMVARLVIVPALPGFHARYPEVQLELGVSDRPVDLILENVDCALRRGPITDESLVARRLCESPFVTCASPAYLERYGVPRHPLDLENTHPVVGLFSTLNGLDMSTLSFTRDGERLEVRGRSLVSVNESGAYHALALGGMGIIQAPAFTVYEAVRDGQLRRILSEWTVDPGTLFAVYPPNRHLSAKVRVFVDWAHEVFATHECTRHRKPGEPNPCALDYSAMETENSA